ncbi:MAG: ABC transporter ATP-binding protein [Candidatus Electryonea clarkiae]|nr:ABC transporter ATP-binding protein [Candidatus Electryonea clarkiae]MDP8287513.1 ABC transporter ATP-binding protein [Candidatus Electryonea clarkiae]
MNTEILLKIENLAKKFGETSALKDLSLEVSPGKIVGLIGPDGAGKTTAMRIACGLMLPDAGKVFLSGVDVQAQPRKAKNHLGYMPQRFSLYQDLTVSENIRFFADLYHVPKKERLEREERLMKFSRLSPFRKRRAGDLSGGMKQKLALSCTLIHTPEVLILDEPTTGVDPVSRQEFWAILKTLQSEGIAQLISTPYMDEALLCDRILLVHHGKVISQGTPDEVLKNYNRRLLNVLSTDAASVRNALSKKNFDEISVLRYGDSLHIVYDTDEQLQVIKSVLSKLNMEPTEIQPSIEDVFVELLSSTESRAA